MRHQFFITGFAFLVLTFAPERHLRSAEQASDQPKAIPVTRSEMKEKLESLKSRQPRLALPLEGTDRAREATVNNARARRYFLPAEWFAGEQRAFGGGTDDLVDYELKTKCFWVVSRGNNCHYCLGHQEHKLQMIGLSDDSVAALDADWSSLDPRTRKALELARKMTLKPHEFTDQDIESLRPEFNDQQIIELVYTIARFNATNRWTDSMGLPQDSVMRGEPITFLTPTAARWDSSRSMASPDQNDKRGLPSSDETERALAAAATRTARVSLPTPEATRTKFSLSKQTPITDWHRALAALVSSNGSTVANHEAMLSHEELSPPLKAQLLRRTALSNRSWASLAAANRRLEVLGVAPADARPGVGNNAAEAAALAFADKLTNASHAVSDRDVIDLREHYTDRQIAQMIHVIAIGNSIDRFTETLGLSSAEYRGD